MTFARLLLRNLFYHWRGNAAVVLGVAVGTAVLTGALLVGDSLRGSLRDLTLRQLEWVDHALVAGRFFREDVAEELKAERVAPALILQGAVSAAEEEALPRRAGRVTVYGVERTFWTRGSPFGDAPGGVFLNGPLARELGVRTGDTVIIHLQKASSVPRESLLGRRDAESVVTQLTLSVRGVLADYEEGANFNLNPSPAPPRNAFVSLSVLQEALGVAGRANALLVKGGTTDALQADLRRRLTLDDWDLVLHTPESRTEELFRKLDKNGDGRLDRRAWNGHVAESFVAAADRDGDKVLTRDEVAAFYRENRAYLSLESRRMILEPVVADAAERAAKDAGLRSAPTLVYLVETIGTWTPRRSFNPEGEGIPYSVVAALDPSLAPPLGPFLPPGVDHLADDEIVLADWKESPLKAKPGDGVLLDYRRAETLDWKPPTVPLPADAKMNLGSAPAAMEGLPPSKFVPGGPYLRLRGFVPLDGVTADPDLTPEFPGVTDKLDLRDWDPPFPYDGKRIKPRDERYWKQYRTTPKAYVTLKKGQELWGSRFGKLTSIRLAPATGAAGEDFRRRLLEQLPPEQGGFVFDPVRERGLQASAGGTDFGGLFLGFSSFLIIAALLLVGLLFRLSLDRRASEVGLLLATGYRRGVVLRLLLVEGTTLAVVGGAAGTLLAMAYAQLLLHLLQLLWPGGLEGSFLRPHITMPSLAIGFGATLLMSVLTVFLALFGLRRVPPRALLAGATSADEATEGGRPRWSGKVALSAAALGLLLLLIAGSVRDHEMRAMTFFGSGMMFLTACLAGVWRGLRAAPRGLVRGRGAFALARLGVRNAARHPVRSLLTAGLLASAVFLTVAVESFRRDADDDFLSRESGSGGFALIAESDVPLFRGLTDEADDRLERRLTEQFAGDPDKVRDALASSRAVLKEINVAPLRLRAGDDASCLNLYQPRKPRLFGLPRGLTNRPGFRFSQLWNPTLAEQHLPWLMLVRPQDDGAIPVFGEANTVVWMLKSGLGQTLDVPDERGNPVKLRVVGLLQDSVFQSGLLMSEENFLKLYPSQPGYNVFLVETPPGRADEVKAVLETALGDRGLEVTPSKRLLEAYLAVENTYLSTFQALGALGLILGTLGLAVVLLRSVWERRGELALLRALGYRHRALGWLLLAENGFLLLLGLGIGTAAALLSVAPHLMSGEGSVPWPRLLGLLGLVLLTGLLAGAAALAATLRAPLIPALRRE